jgi:hypothetical protein
MGLDDTDVLNAHLSVVELRKGLARRFMSASGLGNV